MTDAAKLERLIQTSLAIKGPEDMKMNDHNFMVAVQQVYADAIAGGNHAHNAMMSPRGFWLWGSEPGQWPMPVVVYGIKYQHLFDPPTLYSYVVLPSH